MRLDHRKAPRLYAAIRNPISELRIETFGGITIEDLDKALVDLEKRIWNEVRNEINKWE